MIQLSLNSEMNFVIHPELQQLFCSIACSIIGGPRESSYFTKFSTTKGKTSKIKTHYSSLKKKTSGVHIGAFFNCSKAYPICINIFRNGLLVGVHDD